MFFSKPAWRRKHTDSDYNWDKALKSIEKITDPKKLAKIVKLAPAVHIRCEAVKRIADQSILTEIAKTDAEAWVRIAAADQLNDRNLAQKIYLEAYVAFIKADADKLWREEVIGKITDQFMLANIVKIAALGRLWYDRDAALDRLTDPKILVSMAKSSKDERLCLLVAERIADPSLAQETYTFIAQNSNDGNVRMEAIEKLTDPKLDQEVYAFIAQRADSGHARLKAIEKLTDRKLAQRLCADIVKTFKDYSICKDALEKITDQSVLADIAKNNWHKYIRKAACEGLTDQSLLIDIALNAVHFEVLDIAIGKLTDTATLRSISQSKDNKYTKVEKTVSQEEAPRLYYTKPDVVYTEFDLRKSAKQRLAELQ